VHNRPANWVITALLMLQLTIGLQWQVAHAAAEPAERTANHMGAGDCPGHQSKRAQTADESGAGASTSASSSSHAAGKHDCCRALGCQCHFAQSPGVLDLPRANAAFSAVVLLPVFDARPPVARPNELFRPPIA
jgi:hypothetical protein